MKKRSGPKKGTKLHYHGLSGTPIWHSYNNMIRRCHDPKNDAFGRYGAIGIVVCDRWRFGDGTLNGFQCFVADMPLHPGKGYSIERPKNDEGYHLGNAVWATAKQQAANRRSNIIVEIGGEKLILSEAIIKFGKASDPTIRARIARGWSYERALLTVELTIAEKRARGQKAAAAKWSKVHAMLPEDDSAEEDAA